MLENGSIGNECGVDNVFPDLANCATVLCSRSAQLRVVNSLGTFFFLSLSMPTFSNVGVNGTAKVQRLFFQLWTDNQTQCIFQLSFWLCLRRLLVVIADLKNSAEKKNIALGEIRHVIFLSGRQTKSSDRGGKRQKLADFNEVCNLFQRFLFATYQDSCHS